MRTATRFLFVFQAFLCLILFHGNLLFAGPGNVPANPNGIPVIGISPDTVKVNFANCNGSTVFPLKIYNTGGSDLNFTANQVTNFFEDFESGLERWTYTGYWGISTDAWEGSGSLDENPAGYYSNNMSQYIQLNDSLLIQNPDSCILKFWMKRSMECCCDYLSPQIRVNNGSWISLSNYNCNEGWTQKILDLSSYVNSGDLLRFRFAFTSDYSVTSLGVNIDNIYIGGIGSVSSWMNFSPDAGTILPGDSTVIYLTINATGMNSGNYYNSIMLNSNDPVNPILLVPIFLTIIGQPEISVNSYTVNLPPVMAYTTGQTQFKIYNLGCATLQIDSVNSSSLPFLISFSPASLPPNDSIAVTVDFEPTGTGMFYANLHIYNNDSNLILQLVGEGTPLPIISLSPPGINLTMTDCADTASATMTIHNNGLTLLEGDVTSEFSSVVIPPPLCTPQTLYNCYGEGIVHVILNTIDNNSTNGCYGYQNFDSISTTLNPGQSYTIEVYTGTGGEDVKAWIDYNSDGIFNMNNEVILESSYASYHSGGFTVPNDLVSGVPMRMRVMSDDYYNPELQPCNDVQYGQAEDYTVFVGGLPIIVPDTFSIVAGDSAQILLSFPANLMMSGLFQGNLIVTSNDPLHPIMTLPFQVSLDGAPQLFISNSLIPFPDIIEYTSATENFTITNNGCDSLFVYNIISSLPEYTVNPVTFNLLPGESKDVSVTFASNLAGGYPATLEIQNNDVTTYINLTGNVLGAPQIAVNPDSLHVVINGCGDSLIVPVMVYNTGSDTLLYQFHQVSNWEENFENGISGWYTVDYGQDDLWHVSQLNSHSPTHALWCGIESQANYNTGRRINTAIVSPPIDLTYVTNNIVFSFWEIFNTEGGYDRCMVDVSIDNGVNWIQLRGSGPSGSSGGWVNPSFNLSAYAGHIIRIRFYFDTGDAASNSFSGWFVDNLNISNAGTGMNWLSILPDSASVIPGDSSLVNFTFHSLNIPSGVHYQLVHLSSNATLLPNIIMPVFLELNGISIPGITTNQLTFPTIMQYTSAVDSLQVTNTGCDTLFVSSILPSIPDFQANPDTFFVLPFDSVYVKVNFTPQDTGIIIANMVISTNTGNLTVNLLGQATGAPIANITPDTIDIVFTGCNDTTNIPVTLSNTGLIDLYWQSGVNINAYNNKALFFDNSNDYGYFGYWNAGSQWTLEAWVKPTSLPSGRNTIIGGVSSCIDWAIVMENGQFGVAIRPSGGACNQTILSPGIVVPGNWYHIAATNDGNVAKIYVNGVLMNQGTVDPNYTGFYYIYMAYEYCCYPAGFPGTIDEVRVWNMPRSAFEINSWMHRTLPGPETGLIAYYKLDEGTGSTLNDGSGSGHDGSMDAATWVNSDSPVNNFIESVPNSGIVPAGTNTTIYLMATSTYMMSGTYQANMIVTSNDPLHPVITIPVNITVEGNPKIELSETCLNYGTILQFASKTDTFNITNGGCDTLFINDILPSSSAFTVSASSMTILPSSQEQVIVTFHPTAIGSYNDTIWVYNNDIIKWLCLSGDASPIPQIVTLPDIIYDTLICDVDGMKELVIKNTGIIPLSYTIANPVQTWLHINPPGGLLLSGDSVIHQITYSKVGLAAGVHEGQIVISSNDPLHNPKTVVMSLNVLNPYNPVNLGPDHNICAGSTIILDAGSGYLSYLWNDNSTADTLTVSTSGIYYVVVNDNFNCIYTDTIATTYFLYPIINAGHDTTVCQGTTYTFNPQFQNLLPISPAVSQVGTETAYTSSVGSSPFGTYYMDDLTQMLYRSSELVSVGIAPGSITAIAFNVGNVGSPGMQGFNIKIGHTLQNTLSGFIGGLITVYSASSFTPVVGWNEFTLTQPFYWDGVQNIVIEVCFNNNSYISTSSVQYTNVANTVWSGWCDNCAPGCSITGGNGFSERANVRLSGSGDVTIYTWTGPGSYNSHLKNATIYNINFGNAGIYYLDVDNGVGCTDKDTVIVAVNPSPTANAGNDVAIVYGTSTMLNAMASGGIPPYIYSWTPVTSLSNPNIGNPVANPTTTTTYTVHATAQNDCGDDDDLVITVLPIYQINGTITYKNTSSTPLSDLAVYLKGPGGIVIDTSITNSGGEYLFEQLVNNTYTYNIVSNKPWSGGNATDALLVAKHIVYLITLSGINLTAADVNNSGTLTSADPLLIMRRAVGLITSFPAGNWTFENSPIIVSNSNVTRNIQGLCVGDVNGSFIPGSKTSAAITLEENGSLGIPQDGILELPVRVEENFNLGAITFGVHLSGDIAEVLDVTNGNGNIEWHVNDGNILRIAWQDVDGMILNPGDPVLTIKLRLKDRSLFHEPLLTLTEDCEFADINAHILTPIKLFMPQPGNSTACFDASLEALPNPFSKELTLVYSLPDDGKLVIELYDVYGRILKQMFKGDITAGSYRQLMNGDDLPAGVYYLELRHQSGDKLFSRTVSIVKTH